MTIFGNNIITNPPWDAKKFEEVVGHPPEQDDLERVNCRQVNQPSHRFCGLCPHGTHPAFIGCEKCHQEWEADYVSKN